MTTTDTPQSRPADLFTPIRVGRDELKNRIVLAPMTRSRAGEGNVPHALNAEYYRQRASAGLIITEASQVTPYGVGYPATPGIHSAEQVLGWKGVTDAVHAEGGKIYLQLWHVGRISHSSYLPNNALPVAPSAIAPDGEKFTFQGNVPYEVPRALKTEELPGIVEDYANGTVNALAAGFDGVEVHAANGYLIDQFLRDGTNQRDDAYGGSIENRARFMLEVTDAAVAAAGADRVGIRLSPAGSFNSMSDSNPDATFGYAVEQLAKRGLAYLHVVEDRSGAPVDWAALRRGFDGPYMTNGGFDYERGTAAIASGAADLVSYGSRFLANPDLPARFRAGAPLSQPDPATFYGGDGVGYTDYPTLAEEAEASAA